MTADTVAVETPAVLATSLMVATIGVQQIDLAHYRPVAAPRKALRSPGFKDKLDRPRFFRLRELPDWGKFSKTVSRVSPGTANQLGGRNYENTGDCRRGRGARGDGRLCACR